MVVHGWREIISSPFAALYSDILQANGYDDWAVEFTFQDPSLENKVEQQKLALQAYSLGAMPETRLYELMEWQPLSKDELTTIKEQKANGLGMM